MQPLIKFGFAVGMAGLLAGCSDSTPDGKQSVQETAEIAPAAIEEAMVSYANDVLPILQQNCFECHKTGGQGEQASGLNMETYDSLMKGTKFGAVIKPGDGVNSTLVMLVEGRANPVLKMPHGGREPLNAQQIQTIKSWIDQGAQNN